MRKSLNMLLAKAIFLSALMIATLPQALVSAETNPPATTKIFWGSDDVGPGNVVLLYGGGLANVKQVEVRNLPNGQPIKAESIQPCDGSVKFILPKETGAGVFSVTCGEGGTFLLNRPELWFMQPTMLQPGLDENQASPGATVQLIGKNMLLPGEKGAPRIALRRDGKSLEVQAEKSEKFSLVVKLPGDLAVGCYELWAHNGSGGDAGWGGPLAVEIKQPDVWPTTVFNVRDFGAKGDDVTDDTKAIREALAAAEKNGGGVVLLPWGTYRLSDWIFIPERTTLRGDGRESTLLKWPVDEPKSLEDFQRAVLYASARYAVEDVTLIVRKADITLCDMSLEINYNRTVPPELLAKLRSWGQSRDKFLRRVRFQHWLLVAHPETHPEMAKKYAAGIVFNFRGNDLRNFEVSDCVFQGGHQPFNNVVNGRIVRNSFSSQLGPCSTCLGGGGINLVCESNELRCASSFGWGWIGLQRVYSAHNKSWNFERGEREAMTCDVSALPTARPVSQYWGPCAEAGTRDGKAFLRFEGVNWTPGCFSGGAVILRAGNQNKAITGNTTDTVFLDQPFKPALTNAAVCLVMARRNDGVAWPVKREQGDGVCRERCEMDSAGVCRHDDAGARRQRRGAVSRHYRQHRRSRDARTSVGRDARRDERCGRLVIDAAHDRVRVRGGGHERVRAIVRIVLRLHRGRLPG